MRKTGLCVLLLFSVISGICQSSSFTSYKSGSVFMTWGWNVDAFSKSNISLKGADYDFKLYKVAAHHRPTPLSYKDYLKIDRITIPQTNFRIGYFIKDNLAITAGVDHMKYVMDQNQTVTMKGTISREGAFKGTYNGPQVISEELLTFEHTDGLNYVNVEAEKHFNWFHLANDHVLISGFAGAGAGVLVPKTNAKLLNYERNDRFHLSGFGIGMKGGIEFMFFKHLALRFENKYGYINMPDIILHKRGIEGRAKQSFFFAQFNGMLGLNFNLGKSNKAVK